MIKHVEADKHLRSGKLEYHDLKVLWILTLPFEFTCRGYLFKVPIGYMVRPGRVSRRVFRCSDRNRKAIVICHYLLYQRYSNVSSVKYAVREELLRQNIPNIIVELYLNFALKFN